MQIILVLSLLVLARTAAEVPFDQCAVDILALETSSRPVCAHVQMARPRFVLFGDSLTQRSFDEGGWGAKLASLYQRKVSFFILMLEQ